MLPFKVVRQKRALPAFVLLSIALVYVVYDAARFIVEPTFPVPSFAENGQIEAATGRRPGIFAAVTHAIYGSNNLLLTHFAPNESPVVIGNAQPYDAIAFTCPPGTNIPVNRAFSLFPTGQLQWIYGSYVGDEGERLSGGESANSVFSSDKFFGRAGNNYPFVNPAGSLVVSNAIPSPGQLFFATADVTQGQWNHVRCSIPSPSVCGDFFIDDIEQCDNGDQNANTANQCRTNCVNPFCGDAITDTGEECDDGNGNDADGCTSFCQSAAVPSSSSSSSVALSSSSSSTDGGPLPPPQQVCGDGSRTGSEECDDGNLINTDGCLHTCLSNICGDGYNNTPSEACDDGKTCMGTDGEGNAIGDGSWCDTNADCASQPGTTCSLHSNDGCTTSCSIESLFVCELRTDTNPPVPERSYCAFTGVDLPSSSASSSFSLSSSSDSSASMSSGMSSMASSSSSSLSSSVGGAPSSSSSSSCDAQMSVQGGC